MKHLHQFFARRVRDKKLSCLGISFLSNEIHPCTYKHRGSTLFLLVFIFTGLHLICHDMTNVPRKRALWVEGKKLKWNKSSVDPVCKFSQFPIPICSCNVFFAFHSIWFGGVCYGRSSIQRSDDWVRSLSSSLQIYCNNNRSLFQKPGCNILDSTSDLWKHV